MIEEVIMVPAREFEHLTDSYKGQESAFLNKAGRLVAEQHLILEDFKIPLTQPSKWSHRWFNNKPD